MGVTDKTRIKILYLHSSNACMRMGGGNNDYMALPCPAIVLGIYVQPVRAICMMQLVFIRASVNQSRVSCAPPTRGVLFMIADISHPA